MQPSEPNTPPDSAVWRFIHHPMTLLVLSIPMIVACALLYGTINHAMGAKTNDSAGLLSAFMAPAFSSALIGRSSASSSADRSTSSRFRPRPGNWRPVSRSDWCC